MKKEEQIIHRVEFAVSFSRRYQCTRLIEVMFMKESLNLVQKGSSRLLLMAKIWSVVVIAIGVGV